jgi:hypothetical protein
MSTQQQDPAAAAAGLAPAGTAPDRGQPNNNHVLSLRKENSRLRQCNQRIQEVDDAEMDRYATWSHTRSCPATSDDAVPAAADSGVA